MDAQRKRLRLESFDYAIHGAYFVTICTQGRRSLFGQVVAEEIQPSPAGRMIEAWWKKLPTKFRTVAVDEVVVMPNHVHGVLWMVAADLRVGPVGEQPKVSIALPEVMQWFKTMTTNEYIRRVKQNGWPSFDKKLWQRSFHDRIIRDERELHGIREYIRANPRLWAEDEENPERIAPPDQRARKSKRADT
jgi:REP element-mobilizing transposase RayT